MSSTAGSITVPNGGTGSIADVTQVPFVTGVVPVVGGFADSAAPHFGLMGMPAAGSGSTMLDERLARLRRWCFGLRFFDRIGKQSIDGRRNRADSDK